MAHLYTTNISYKLYWINFSFLWPSWGFKIKVSTEKKKQFWSESKYTEKSRFIILLRNLKGQNNTTMMELKLLKIEYCILWGIISKKK